MEMLRSDDEFFEKFGQVYVSTTYPGVIKAWHYHRLQRDNVTCIKGMLKVVLYDSREDSETRGELMELFIGDLNPALISIPPMIYHGWKCVSECMAFAVNAPTEAYNYESPDEYRLPYDDPTIPYQWEIKMG